MSGVVAVRSDRCGLDELFLAYQAGEAGSVRLIAELNGLATSLAKAIDAAANLRHSALKASRWA
jgi:hypothetical protein